MEDLTSLIIRAQSGNLDAFGIIVQRVQDMAVGYAHSILGDFHLAEDAAQEAFIGAYRDLNKLREPAAFPSWLRKLVFKHCDRLTRGMRLETIPLKAAVNLPSEEKEPAEAVEEKEMKDNVLAAISALPEKERVVTTLFYINGYSHQEIAEFLEVPATTVNHRLRASRKRLKGKLFTMVQDDLQEKRPSKDKRFANKVQLFNAAETGNVDKVRELLDSDATRAVLYDFLKARAEEQRMSVEELVVWLIERHKKRIEWEATEGKKRGKEWREKDHQSTSTGMLLEVYLLFSLETQFGGSAEVGADCITLHCSRAPKNALGYGHVLWPLYHEWAHTFQWDYLLGLILDFVQEIDEQAAQETGGSIGFFIEALARLVGSYLFRKYYPEIAKNAPGGEPTKPTFCIQTAHVGTLIT